MSTANKEWWEGSFEERMARRAARRGPVLNKQIEDRNRVARLRDIWEFSLPKDNRTLEQRILDAGGVILSEPLMKNGEVNPECVDQLLNELDK